MDPFQHVEPMAEAISRLRALLTYRMKFRRKGFLVFAAMISEKRLWLAHEQDTLAKIWDTIRADSELLDFVVELTRQFFLQTRDLSVWTKEYGSDSFNGYLAEALLESLTQFVGQASMIDSDTLQLINEAKLETYLENPWFMVIQLVDVSCYEDIIMPNGIPDAPAPAGDGT
jgi:hypothetical protein